MIFEGLKYKDKRKWTEFIWLRIGTSGGNLVNLWVPQNVGIFLTLSVTAAS